MSELESAKKSLKRRVPLKQDPREPFLCWFLRLSRSLDMIPPVSKF